MSSYQIPLTPSLKPTSAVLVSLAPDHLDRHGSLEAYLAAKRAIFARASTAVVGVDDELSRAEYDRLCAGESDFAGEEIIAVSGVLPPNGTLKVGVQNDALTDEEGVVCAFPPASSFSSPHNRLNVAAAWAGGASVGGCAGLRRTRFAKLSGLAPSLCDHRRNARRAF